jgi:transposase
MPPGRHDQCRLVGEEHLHDRAGRPNRWRDRRRHHRDTLTAAQVLVSWSYAGRLRSEAAFAALAGVCPVPASSGQHTRYRLNRGGDRQLNRALHSVALVRLRDDRSPAPTRPDAKARAGARARFDAA